MFGRLKDWLRVATRYDRYPKVFLSATALAALVIYWLGGLTLREFAAIEGGKFNSDNWPKAISTGCPSHQ